MGSVVENSALETPHDDPSPTGGGYKTRGFWRFNFIMLWERYLDRVLITVYTSFR